MTIPRKTATPCNKEFMVLDKTFRCRKEEGHLGTHSFRTVDPTPAAQFYCMRSFRAGDYTVLCELEPGHEGRCAGTPIFYVADGELSIFMEKVAVLIEAPPPIGIANWDPEAQPPSASPEDGRPSRIRTCDPLLRRQVLYPTELSARNGEEASRPRSGRQSFDDNSSSRESRFKNGRGDEIVIRHERPLLETLGLDLLTEIQLWSMDLSLVNICRFCRTWILFSQNAWFHTQTGQELCEISQGEGASSATPLREATRRAGGAA
jgi:hypothetical protein